MAVTVQTYDVPASATALQVEAQLRQLLIDAGLMIDWYDRIEGTDGFVHGILQLTNDASKAYGSQFIWFAIGPAGDGVYLQFCSRWNNISHQPSGVQYWDFYEPLNPANYSYNGWWCISTDTSGTTFTRYTSGDQRTTVVRDSDGGYLLTILKSVGSAPAWLDFDHCCAFSVFCLDGDSYGTNYAGLNWYQPFSVRRDWFNGAPHYDTSSGNFARRFYGPMWVFNATGTYYNGLPLPCQTPAQKPTLAQAVRPIITDINVMPPLDCTLGSDFGMVCTTGLTLNPGDTLTVSPAEVWTVLYSLGSADLTANFVARTI